MCNPLSYDRRGQSLPFSCRIAAVFSRQTHVGPVAGFTIEGLTPDQTEYVFGIDAEGNEQPEARLLADFRSLMSDFDVECDEIVGHNIIGFDLPFIFSALHSAQYR